VPNLATHIDLARRTARRLRHPVLDANLGNFLLGSTSPDIRVITRQGRETYHFASLDFESVGAGMSGLFRANPHLASGAVEDPRTRAFMAGYITHLVADETWIVDMFRPYFGSAGVFGDEAVGMMMDRAAQLELDRRAWPVVDEELANVGEGVDHVELGFIPPETLVEWREWVVSFLATGFSWDRLRFMARRVSNGDGDHPAHGVADEFLRSIPESMDRLYELVPEDRLAVFVQRAVDVQSQAVGDYLR
jgi:hypothetical protein